MCFYFFGTAWFRLLFHIRPDGVLVYRGTSPVRDLDVDWSQAILPVEVKSPSTPPRGAGKKKGAKAGAASGTAPTKTASSTRTITRSVGWKPSLTPTQQLASYALEVLSATGLRRSTLGLLISDDRLEVWFYDRAGGIAAESISIQEDFVRFVQLFVALSRASPQELGFEPSIFPPSPFPTHANGAAVPSNSGATWEIIGERLNETRGLVGHGIAARKVVNRAALRSMRSRVRRRYRGKRLGPGMLGTLFSG